MKNDTCEIRPNYVVNVFWEDDDRWYQSSMSIGRFATAYLLSDESRSLINYWQGNVTSPLQWCVVVFGAGGSWWVIENTASRYCKRKPLRRQKAHIVSYGIFHFLSTNVLRLETRQCRHTTLIFAYFISDAFPPKENKKWTIFSESEIWLELRKIRRHASAVIVRNSAKGRARKSNRSISMSDNHLLPLTLMLPLWVINNYKQNLNESAHFVFDARFREFWIRRNPNSIYCCESYYFCGQKLIRNNFPGRDIRAFLRNSMQQVFKDT